MNVYWDDAVAYAAWLSRLTGKSYRLPTEAEWEYAARSGTQTPFPWGRDLGKNHGNCEGCGSRYDGRITAIAGAFAANAFGLHDMHGNVREWVQDCFNESYRGAPDDGSAWLTGVCHARINRGGSWRLPAKFLRSASRNAGGIKYYNHDLGFRVARDM